MPLDVARLRGSEMASDETPETCWAAMMLWCACWHEIPAASIPDNDGWQAKHAGYKSRGKVDKAWESVRDGALRGFVKCSDGRLYHSVVAEKANEAWLSKVRYAYDKLCDRTRKANKARADKGLHAISIPTVEQWISAGKPSEFPMEGDGIPPENALKGQGQGQGQGQPSTSSVHPADAGQPPASGGAEVVKPAVKRAPTAPKKPAPDEKPSVATWSAYAEAYRARYLAEPVRNAKVNGQLAQVVSRLGADESPSVAAFFLTHNNLLYTRAMHPVDLLLRDCEKLRTEWITGRSTGATGLPDDRRSRQLETAALMTGAAPTHHNPTEAIDVGSRFVES